MTWVNCLKCGAGFELPADGLERYCPARLLIGVHRIPMRGPLVGQVIYQEYPEFRLCGWPLPIVHAPTPPSASPAEIPPSSRAPSVDGWRYQTEMGALARRLMLLRPDDARPWVQSGEVSTGPGAVLYQMGMAWPVGSFTTDLLMPSSEVERASLPAGVNRDGCLVRVVGTGELARKLGQKDQFGRAPRFLLTEADWQRVRSALDQDSR